MIHLRVSVNFRLAILVFTVYIYPFKMASTWRYTLVRLDGVMDISTTD